MYRYIYIYISIPLDVATTLLPTCRFIFFAYQLKRKKYKIPRIC